MYGLLTTKYKQQRLIYNRYVKYETLIHTIVSQVQMFVLIYKEQHLP